jgi:NDP-sugar pyrophosphorylase family protein
MNLNKHKMIILCGGRGKRMGYITKNIPKPMVKVGKTPILEHKINYYKSKGFNNFIFCTGYKSNVIQSFLKKKNISCHISNGGTKAGILKRIFLTQEKIKNTSIISYGDTLAKIDLKDLITKHTKSKCTITIVVAPIQNPFGLVEWNNKGNVIKFEEKPILNHFIGYAVINPNFFNKISKKIVNLRDGKGIVRAIHFLMKKKEVNIYKFKDLQITINSQEELKNAKLNYKKYFTL